jgi:hypothetical protein
MISPEALEKARSLVANYGSDPDGLLVGAIAAALQAERDAAAPKLPDDVAGLVRLLKALATDHECDDEMDAASTCDQAATAIQSLVARNAEPPVPSSTSGRGEMVERFGRNMSGMVPDPDGKYVRYSDHEAELSALKKQVEELTAERDDARRYAVEARLRENQAEDRRVSESFARTKAEIRGALEAGGVALPALRIRVDARRL